MDTNATKETTAASNKTDTWDKMLARIEETKTLLLAAAAAKEAECEGLRK